MDRWQGLSGAVGLGLLLVALVLPGAPPRADQSASSFTATLVDHRAAFVRGTVVASVAVLLLLWFLAGVAMIVRAVDGRNGGSSLSIALGGGFGVTVLYVGMLLFNGVAFRAASMHEPGVVRAAVDTGNMLIEASKFGFAMVLLATCGASSTHQFMSRRLRRAGWVAAILSLATAVPPFFVEHGLAQFGGALDLIGGVPAFAWLGVLSLTIAFPLAARRSAPPAAAAPSP
jgi:hypothetical protein